MLTTISSIRSGKKARNKTTKLYSWKCTIFLLLWFMIFSEINEKGRTVKKSFNLFNFRNQVICAKKKRKKRKVF